MKVGARYYDPTIGRWIQKDPILDGFNWWVYCENDPVNEVDPEGKAIHLLADPFWLLRVSLSYSLLLADIALSSRDLPEGSYGQQYPDYSPDIGKPPQGLDCPFPNMPCRVHPELPPGQRAPGIPARSSCGRGAHWSALFAFALLVGKKCRKREDV